MPLSEPQKVKSCKLHNYYNKNRNSFRCLCVRTDVRLITAQLWLKSSIMEDFSCRTFCINYFLFLQQLYWIDGPIFLIVSNMLSPLSHWKWKFVSMCFSPQKTGLLLIHCFINPCAFISYRSIQNTFSLSERQLCQNNWLRTENKDHQCAHWL